jgi:hypothetical protein
MGGRNDDPANDIDLLRFSLGFACSGKAVWRSLTIALLIAISVAIGLNVLPQRPHPRS